MSLVKHLSFIYQDKLQHNVIQHNELQQHLVTEMAVLFDNNNLDKPRWLRFMRKLFSKPKQGIYIHGSVGTGKSYIARFALNNLPYSIKVASWHFNEFSALVIKYLTVHPGKGSWLNLTKQLSRHYDIIFIDEFDVHDVTIALTIRDIVTKLFDLQVLMIFTSNREPAQLYLHGLQRASFIPLIHLIEEKCIVYNMTGQDYRKSSPASHNFITAEADDIYSKFKAFVKSYYPSEAQRFVKYNGRILPGKLIGRAYFATFSELCYRPLSSNDYRAIVRECDSVFISQITKPALQEKDVLRRMIWLIDEVYESGNRLIAGFNYNYHELQDYSTEMFEIPRMVSRLYELDGKLGEA